jgi:endonuclease/exonuclease/phosphatase family metal-dependent hydrolase
MELFSSTFSNLIYLFEPLPTIICGDFNTKMNDSWYPLIAQEWNHFTTENNRKISVYSIQRRNVQQRQNTTFKGLLDHVFWSGEFTVEYHPKFQLPGADDCPLIPSIENPSDHFPIVFQAYYHNE